MAQRNQIFLITILAATLIAGVAADAATHQYDNGLTVRIHGGADLAAMIDDDNGARVLNHPALGALELLHGIDDSRMLRNDVTEFLPLDAGVVADAFSDLGISNIELTVDVFLLPAPPAEILGSFARRQSIVLSPAFGAVNPETIAELVIHELGHVLTWAYFDHADGVWDRYMDLRGLDPVINGPSAAHADRAREILAEDLRFLIGGELATHHHRIENGDIALPTEVDGLETFLRSAVRGTPFMGPRLSARAWPNPCNPMTNIELRLADGSGHDASSARLQVLDLRGRVVRTIQGGRLENNTLSIQWNGTGDDGRSLPSGTYGYRIGWASTTASGTVALVR